MARKRRTPDGAGEGASPGPIPPRKAVEEAHRDAVRTATRASLLAVVGFGVVLVMLGLLAQGAGSSRPGYSVEHFLALGAFFGGGMFALIAARASRMAKECERRLGGKPR